MPKYIDPTKIKLNALTWTDGGEDILVPLVEVRKAIAQAPVEDVVAVVRCKDCVFRQALDHNRYNYKNKHAMICTWHNCLKNENGYCIECDKDFECDYISECSALYKADYRKQSEGEWIEVDDGVLIGDGKHLECSKCGVWKKDKQRSNFCSHCGARMKGGE